MAFDLTLTNPTFSTDGKFGQGLNGGYGQANNPIPASGPFTIEAWAKGTGTDYHVVAGADKAAWMGQTNAGKAWAYYGNTDAVATSTVTVNDGVRHHWSFNVDPSGATPSLLFIDGVLAAQVTAERTLAFTGKFGVKAHGNTTATPGFVWPGEVDEVTVYSGKKRTANFTPPTAATPNDDANLIAVWHLNGDGLDTRVAPAAAGVQIPYTDVNVFYCPYSWDDRGTYKSTNNPGAYLKTAFSGTSIAVKIDVSAMVAASLPAASYPIVRTVVDGVNFIDTQLTSAGTPISHTGLSAGFHTLEVYFLAVDTATGDRWTTPVQALRISGFTVDTGSNVAAPTIRAKRKIIFGDSIREGYFAAGTVKTQPAGNNALLTASPAIAQELEAEYGVIAFSSQGYQQAGSGNVPNVLNAWSLYSAGRSRLVSGLLSPPPDYITIEHGTNGATTQANVQTLLTSLRAAAPSAKIFQMVPRGGFARAVITAGENAVNDANSYLIDLGTEYQKGISNYTNVANMYSLDGLHPNPLANMLAAAGYAAKIRSALNGVVQPALTTRTVSVALKVDEETVAANLTGLKVSFHDEPTPDKTTTPRYQAANETTDANGVLTFSFGSTLAVGASGHLTVYGAAGIHYNTTVAVS